MYWIDQVNQEGDWSQQGHSLADKFPHVFCIAYMKVRLDCFLNYPTPDAKFLLSRFRRISEADRMPFWPRNTHFILFPQCTVHPYSLAYLSHVIPHWNLETVPPGKLFPVRGKSEINVHTKRLKCIGVPRRAPNRKTNGLGFFGRTNKFWPAICISELPKPEAWVYFESKEKPVCQNVTCHFIFH